MQRQTSLGPFKSGGRCKGLRFSRRHPKGEWEDGMLSLHREDREKATAACSCKCPLDSGRTQGRLRTKPFRESHNSMGVKCSKLSPAKPLRDSGAWYQGFHRDEGERKQSSRGRVSSTGKGLGKGGFYGSVCEDRRGQEGML